MALFHKVIFTVAITLQPAVGKQCLFLLCKLRHYTLDAPHIIGRTVQLTSETGKHDQVAVRIDEPRGQVSPFQVECIFILDGGRLPLYFPYHPARYFNGRQIRAACIHIHYIRIDYLFNHSLASTSCMSFTSLCFIAVLTTSDSSCCVSRLAATSTASENT